MKFGCDEDCRLKCSQRITEADREEAFKTFWGLSNHLLQWQCILKWVGLKDSSRRASNNICTLPTNVVNF